MDRSRRRGDAFSLVELMVVVAIIGILASLAIPRFQVFQAKARQAEAKTNLAHMFTLQQAFFGDNDRYADVSPTGRGSDACSTPNELGFEINPCSASRYQYEATAEPETAFLARASSDSGGSNKVYPGCGADIWTIDDLNCLCAEGDSTRNCDSPHNSCANKCTESEAR